MLSHVASVLLAVGPFFLAPAACPGADPPTGLQEEVRVKRPTRLDWEFVASGFGREAVKLPADFDSLKQRFQLYVPRAYDPARAWPLVVFISPGDAPLGWRYWQKVCEENGMLFCAPYGAGNNCPPGPRARIVLDMLDQVRRDYRIDPERTYLTGFSGGGRMACAIGFALPEYLGGIIPVCGTNPLNRLDYLRHRVHDRLSVAFVTGESDVNRTENEQFMFPMLQDLDIRSRLWVVPKLGHGIPGPAVLAEVRKWLEEDLSRRRQDVKAQPTLACPPDDALTPLKLAGRALEAAEANLKEDERTWRGVALLQGIVARWGRTEVAEKARKRLAELKEDAKRLRLAGEQGGKEERSVLQAQAKALDRFGQTAAALRAWKALAQQHPDTPEGRKAVEEARRLAKVLSARPYLGISFAGESAVVDKVVPDGPADRAGVQPGDRLRALGAAKLQTFADLRRALEKVKPGDKVKLEVERKDKRLTLTVEVGSPPT
ncbi:MAG: PDZ domain-containing protein [Planctomycetes bacterium]|nr:PDZ domain-containing protein [Planctomycetota bacterium]